MNAAMCRTARTPPRAPFSFRRPDAAELRSLPTMSRTRSAPPAPAHPERSETVQMPRLATRLTSRGFSMVEALVALVVLGVGMLGIAGLYVTTLRTSSSAISRMQAVNLPSDLGDRIRANRTAGAAYAGDAAENGDGCVGASAACSAQELAAHDLYVWEQQISATLPRSEERRVGKECRSRWSPWR